MTGLLSCFAVRAQPARFAGTIPFVGMGGRVDCGPAKDASSGGEFVLIDLG
jgi:hypothetical protein